MYSTHRRFCVSMVTLIFNEPGKLYYSTYALFFFTRLDRFIAYRRYAENAGQEKILGSFLQ